MAEESVDLVHKAKNCKLFSFNWVLCHLLKTFLYHFINSCDGEHQYYNWLWTVWRDYSKDSVSLIAAYPKNSQKLLPQKFPTVR